MPISYRKTFLDASLRHVQCLKDTLQNEGARIELAYNIIRNSIATGGCVFFCGNGGSAASAQHIAAEFVGHYRKTRRPLCAIALTTDTSAITAIGNDYGYEYVFARQLEALIRPHSCLVALSTSGRSKNILRATESALQKTIPTIALVGANGLTHEDNPLLVEIRVASEETARIQEVHDFIMHTWCEHLDTETT